MTKKHKRIVSLRPTVDDIEELFQKSWEQVLKDVIEQRAILEQAKELVAEGPRGAMQDFFSRMTEGLMDYAAAICVFVFLARRPLGTLEDFIDFLEEETMDDGEDVLRDEDWMRIRRVWTEIAGERRG